MRLKRILYFICSVVLCVLFTSTAYAENERTSLYEMSDEDCLQTLISFGMEVPEGYRDYPDLAGFVKKVVDSVIENPNRDMWYNYTEAENFALIIREKVLEYEGIFEEVTLGQLQDKLSLSRSAYSLVYSTQLYSYHPNYSSYRCYAYAINKISVIGTRNPGCMIGLTLGPSDFATMTVSRLALITTYDLQQLGYTDITYSTTRPQYNAEYRVVALRKCSEDFHFMYLANNQYQWHHKPGGGTILRFNYTTLTSGKWTNETVSVGGYIAPTLEYDSDIIYIRYKL